jgi:spore maturation protein CgeB
MRMKALEDLGHQTTPVDTHPESVIRWEATVAYRAWRRLFGPLDFARASRAILRKLRTDRFDLLWLDKTLTIPAATLRKAKSLQPDCRIIGYSPDDMHARHNQSRRFLEQLPLYDLYVTTKSYGVRELRALGCPKVEFVGNAFDPQIHRPMELTAEDHRKYDSEVGFIGSYEPDRAECLGFLADCGVKLRIIGNYWDRWPIARPLIKMDIGEVVGQEYAKAICSTKINLCFLRKINRDLQTTRSIEIPACGAFMLAERTDEHLALFEEGKEAEFFSSNQELLDKVRYYLEHPQQRERIAAAGLHRCFASGYRYQDRMQQILERL